ncbi:MULTISPECIES: nitroreductase family protein [unclassified Cryobacterium]|uniref:nitroreductase family protein n=1 Tax=unclassified Cryobacterium TaxID=2649013 RepID=UPI002AB5A47F|nr:MULTISPECIES: nitroreductase family protein [unclassified Cryobacterium]MDY7541371.1 nitroreductase family protein [Cryobacterium sp. 5B3]MEA9998171.1 nitroreductase family protein [Cryobacterium sp. RTS3]MEB0265361.1 nitroreductase family protein [Cryobacterium sp. 10I5]MEB0273330.1 nitroreductase family protein [Cryobacterium sp. 5B3]
MSTPLEAIGGRRSFSAVTADAPTHEALLPLVAACARVADHGALRPWRLIELRGDARTRLGAAFVAASARLAAEAGAEPPSAADLAKLAGKPLRASLLIAVVASHRESDKVEAWEQDVTAAGVGHALSLLLTHAGWGVMWRTGALTRTPEVHRLHGLTESEDLLGWLYVGGVPTGAKPGVRLPVDPAVHLTVL